VPRLVSISAEKVDSKDKNIKTKQRFDCRFVPMYYSGGRRMRTYTIYSQCEHCGVYDRDPEWCTLCGKPKRREGTKPLIPRADGQIKRIMRKALAHQ
jgi:hypothetical protein